MFKNKSGFTLIELMVVISVIGMLASVVLAAVSTSRVHAQDAKMKEDVRSVATAVSLFYSNLNKVPANHLSVVTGDVTDSQVDPSQAVIAQESNDPNDPSNQAYMKSMQELVNAGVFPTIPRSPNGNSFCYINTDNTPEGAIFCAKLSDNSTFSSAIASGGTGGVSGTPTVSGQVDFDNYVGTGVTPPHTLVVVFTATDNVGADANVLKTWTPQTLINTGGEIFNYTLTGVPAGTRALSAKATYSLRKKLPVSLYGNLAVVNFTGSNWLLGADLNNDNIISLTDYNLIRTYWSTNSPVADVDGSGFVDSGDYSILQSNWYKQGDPI